MQQGLLTDDEANILHNGGTITIGTKEISMFDFLHFTIDGVPCYTDEGSTWRDFISKGEFYKFFSGQDNALVVFNYLTISGDVAGDNRIVAGSMAAFHQLVVGYGEYGSRTICKLDDKIPENAEFVVFDFYE